MIRAKPMERFTHDGIECAIHSSQPSPILKRGWGNGYVRIPRGHPWFLETNNEYDKDAKWNDVDVHGGITYASFNSRLFPNDPDAVWIGWDSAHFDDCLERWPKQSVQYETEKLARQIKEAQ